MGAAVLPPQDCFASPQSRQSWDFSSCVSNRNSTVPSPSRKTTSNQYTVASDLVADCARHCSFDGANLTDGRGLLGRKDASAGLLPLPDCILPSPYHSLYSIPAGRHILDSCARGQSTCIRCLKVIHPHHNVCTARTQIHNDSRIQTDSFPSHRACQRCQSALLSFNESGLQKVHASKYSIPLLKGTYSEFRHSAARTHVGKEDVKLSFTTVRYDGRDTVGKKLVLSRHLRKCVSEKILANATLRKLSSEENVYNSMSPQCMKSKKHCGGAENPPMDEKEDGAGSRVSPTTSELYDALNVQSPSIYEKSEAVVLVDGSLSPALDNSTWLSFIEKERWAGPSFFNSPPPNSLPVPSFTRKLSRTMSSTNVSYHDVQQVQSSIIPESKRTWDVAFATEDLRRMLHLDHADSIDGA